MSSTAARSRERLTRERVIDAALQVLDTEGADGVTMRRVGRELGVEAMSLYNHVQDKDDLLDGICERIMSEYRYPPESDDWTQTARAAAREWRRLFRAHPNAVLVFAARRKPMASPSALGPMEYAIGLLRGLGLSDQEAIQAFHAFGGYIQGYVMMEQGPLFGRPEDGAHSYEHEQLAASLPVDVVPNLVATLPHFHDCDPDQQFEFGLGLLIDGLKTRVGGR